MGPIMEGRSKMPVWKKCYFVAALLAGGFLLATFLPITGN